jgi:hypothetical protein
MSSLSLERHTPFSIKIDYPESGKQISASWKIATPSLRGSTQYIQHPHLTKI